MGLDEFCVEKYEWWVDWRDGKDTSWFIVFNCEILIWVVGILGNLVNVIVFRHKNMSHSPINSIFWWLSISDLLELVILGLFQWDCECEGSLQIISTFIKYESIFHIVRHLSCLYLFQVFHAITIALNIVLVLYQYFVVSRPLRNKDILNDQSVKLTVICIYISSFVLFLPFWNINEVKFEEDLWYFKMKEVNDPLVYTCVLLCGIILRIGPLIILTMVCTLLLYAIRSAYPHRENLGMQACHLSRAQKEVNRMNVTIVMIIIMFLISDLPLGISSFFILSENNNSLCDLLIDVVLLFPLVLLNSSYSIFCYLIRIKQYRETLELLLSETKNRVSFRDPVTEQTDVELNSF